MPPSRIAPLPLGEALIRSLTLAFMTMVTSTVLGVMSAQAFRRKFKGSGFVFYLIVLGMMVPGVLTGLGVSLLANNILGIERHWWSTAFVTHVVYTFPFAFLVMLRSSTASTRRWRKRPGRSVSRPGGRSGR